MKRINLQKILEAKQLKKRELAEQLFPERSHPLHSINRVIKGEGELNETQISKLSTITGLTVGQLFGDLEWTAGKPEGVTFKKGRFTVRLNRETGVSYVYDSKSLFHEEVFTLTEPKVSEYFDILNNLILKNFQK